MRFLPHRILKIVVIIETQKRKHESFTDLKTNLNKMHIFGTTCFCYVENKSKSYRKFAPYSNLFSNFTHSSPIELFAVLFPGLWGDPVGGVSTGRRYFWTLPDACGPRPCVRTHFKKALCHTCPVVGRRANKLILHQLIYQLFAVLFPGV